VTTASAFDHWRGPSNSRQVESGGVYGYGKPEDLARWEPDYRVFDMRELLPA